MDPLNNNPASNAPAPAAPAPEPAAPTPETAPAAPATPVVPVAPAAPAVNPDVANAALNPPVNPVVAPGASATPAAPVAPAPMAPGAPAQMSMNQMFQSQPAAQGGVLDETTAISVPEGPKPVDPVEEELKAPLKAAAPAPGSIGSAVSGPADPNGPASVPFNDPAQAANNPMTANAAPQAKKNSIFDKLMAKTKMSKSTLILLAAVCGIIVILLIVVLVMVATGQL